MDKNTLVATLIDLFGDKQKMGNISIDAFGLAPAYDGVVTNSFVLGISAPGMPGRDCYEKADAIIDILFAYTTVELRKMIDRVRVYDSIDELKSYEDSNYDSFSCDVCARPVNQHVQMFEVA